MYVVGRALPTYLWRYVVGVLFFIAGSFFLFYLLARGTWGLIGLSLLFFFGCYFFIRGWASGRQWKLFLTNRRVILLSHPGLFQEVISAVPYADITRVAIARSGIMARVWRYGSVLLYIAGAEAAVRFDYLARLEELHRLIEELRADEKGVFHDDENEGEAQMQIKTQETHRQKATHGVVEEFLLVLPQLSPETLSEVRDRIVEQLEEV